MFEYLGHERRSQSGSEGLIQHVIGRRGVETGKGPKRLEIERRCEVCGAQLRRTNLRERALCDPCVSDGAFLPERDELVWHVFELLLLSRGRCDLLEQLGVENPSRRGVERVAAAVERLRAGGARIIGDEHTGWRMYRAKRRNKEAA